MHSYIFTVLHKLQWELSMPNMYGWPQECTEVWLSFFKLWARKVHVHVHVGRLRFYSFSHRVYCLFSQTAFKVFLILECYNPLPPHANIGRGFKQLCCYVWRAFYMKILKSDKHSMYQREAWLGLAFDHTNDPIIFKVGGNSFISYMYTRYNIYVHVCNIKCYSACPTHKFHSYATYMYM